MPGDIIILHKCTTSYNHMLYCSWDMVFDRCICYFLFWAIFCPFMPPYLAAQKIKIFKRWETFLEISSFYICVPKTMIRWCKVTEISCMMDGWMVGWTDGWTHGQKKGHMEVGTPPQNCWSGPIKNISILIFTKINKNNNKNKEKHLEISIFYTCVPIIFMMWSIVL